MRRGLFPRDALPRHAFPRRSRTGRLLSVFLTTRMNHPSFIVFALGLILLISMGLLILRSSQDDPDWTFSSFCSGGDSICAASNASAHFY